MGPAALTLKKNGHFEAQGDYFFHRLAGQMVAGVMRGAGLKALLRVWSMAGVLNQGYSSDISPGTASYVRGRSLRQSCIEAYLEDPPSITRISRI